MAPSPAAPGSCATPSWLWLLPGLLSNSPGSSRELWPLPWERAPESRLGWLGRDSRSLGCEASSSTRGSTPVCSSLSNGTLAWCFAAALAPSCRCMSSARVGPPGLAVGSSALPWAEDAEPAAASGLLGPAGAPEAGASEPERPTALPELADWPEADASEPRAAWVMPDPSGLPDAGAPARESPAAAPFWE